ncbi:hypothetical protein [Dyella acidisoli]|uniref:DUF1707 domain-containing protein n=1 Tax=Dyella acidisoli TaxID=1867834 RepID=A0ABQ5XHM7_9GAMM|nr:hypothetical protein [Dyella acidisoli]GLQ91184.1 hypothetical protein GCM10007901_01340 [Dyella acidisoli]
MNERERHINHSLHALDDAHRLGRISREEYRSRRRHLLGALLESHVVTARNVIVRQAVSSHEPASVSDGDVLPGLFPPRHAAWKLITVVVIGVLLCVLILYWLLKMR